MPKNKLPDNQLDIFNDFNFVPGKKPEQAAGEEGLKEKIGAEPAVSAADGKPKTYNDQVADRVIKEIYEKIEIAKRKSAENKIKPVITSLKGLQAQAEAEEEKRESEKAAVKAEKTETEGVVAEIMSEISKSGTENKAAGVETTAAKIETEEDDIEPFSPADEYYNRFAGFSRRK